MSVTLSNVQFCAAGDAGLDHMEETFSVIPACTPEDLAVISISSDVSDEPDVSDSSSYSVVDHVARSFRGWITVTAKAFDRAVVSRVKEFVRKIFRNSGLDILRRTAVLRI